MAAHGQTQPSTPAAAGRTPAGGVLYLVATPVGNLEDITLRALRVLAESDIVACEDTRTTRKILQRHDLPEPRLFAHHEHNEDASAAGILAELAAGRRVAYCSDAGTPGVSDPGYRLAEAARAAGHRIEVIPGASAALTALLASGLPTSTFTFLGFPPRKPGKLEKFLHVERKRRHTLILFESPRRLGGLLAAAHEVLGARRAAVCLELTKKFERVRQGTLAELAAWAAAADAPEKGEATVVIAGAPRPAKDKDEAP